VRPQAAVGDWVALLSGVAVLTLGCVAVASCLSRAATRIDGLAVSLLVLMTAGFGLLWTGSEDWIWLAPAAAIWYAICLWGGRNPEARNGTTILLVVALALSVAGAYRQIEAPCLLTGKASPQVRSAIAYAKQTGPGDLAVGFWRWTNWLHYGLDRDRLYLYLLSFDTDWRLRLRDGLRHVPPSGRIFVTADVVEPTDIDALEMWDRVGRANGMARADVLRILAEEGALVRRDGMLPDEPIWELKRIPAK
jgi:hypothetical protein